MHVHQIMLFDLKRDQNVDSGGDRKNQMTAAAPSASSFSVSFTNASTMSSPDTLHKHLRV